MDEITQRREGDRTSARSTDRSRARSQRAFNRFVRGVLGSPAHRLMSGRLMVIEVAGRRSGTLYAVPTAYAEHDGQVLAASAGRWVRNLAPDRPVVLVHRGRRRTVVAEVANTRERAWEIASALLPPNPILRRNMVVRLGPDGLPDEDQFDAAFRRGVRFLAFRPGD